MPGGLNWWIGLAVALGSALFMAGGVLGLAPGVAQDLSLAPEVVNAIYFAGSIPFTTAAWIQLHEAANAPEYSPSGDHRPRPAALVGWYPRDIGWLSCALQFVGTLLFNVRTFDALLPGLDRLQQDTAIWVPDALGSVLFLASGYLAYAETCDGYARWNPASLSWWVTIINLSGCVGFMVSSVFAYVPAQPFAIDAARLSTGFTLIGAAGFPIGSLLMLPEATPPATAPSAARG